MLTGDTAFHVRQLFRSYGAAFSRDGNTLWMVGVTPNVVPDLPYRQYESMLVKLDAGTGQEQAWLNFPGYEVTALAYDADQDRLFISATPRPTAYEASLDLFVVRASDLKTIGHVAVPRSVVCPNWCDFPVIAVGTEGVFVVQSGSIFEFDYLY
jgi:hypothetical protein